MLRKLLMLLGLRSDSADVAGLGEPYEPYEPYAKTVATLADVLQAETAYDQAVLARVQADYSAKSAHGTLAVVIGSPADRRSNSMRSPCPRSRRAWRI
jgi:hypothetical protein